MSFRLALSGLNAASTDLSVTANNLANVATVGFKESRAEFADLFAMTQLGVASTAVGNGVRVASVAQQFTQGNVDFTDNSLDVAISGNGFFILSDDGALSYTRAGAFQVDRAGYVVNSMGQRLQGYPPLPGGDFNTGTLSDIRLLTEQSPPQASSSVEVRLTLPANAQPPAVTPFDPTNPDTFNHASPFTVYDSLGSAHSATLYFSRTATPNQWTVHLYIDGTAVGTPQTLTYSSSGELVAPAGGQINFGVHPVTTGAAALDLTFDFSETTQYGNAYVPTAILDDGFSTGRLIGIDIDSTGVVLARFTNGRSEPLGQIALAMFQNPQGLQKLGNTQWAETYASGPALRGQAGVGDFGTFQSGALEASNVDITEQLVNMITAQRNFQANAQMISAVDAITQSIINIR